MQVFELKNCAISAGAVAGLAALGQRVVQLLVLPQVQPYLKLLEPALAIENPQEVQRAEALRVRGALMQACASCMYGAMTSRQAVARSNAIWTSASLQCVQNVSVYFLVRLT